MKILIAEDHGPSRRLLSALLREQGHQVTETQDGEEAWQSLQGEYFPVLVSDWLMPGMDGIELCRRVRGANSKLYTYVILLTALRERSAMLQGMEAGADDFLSKPLDADHLSARLRVAERILALQKEVRQLSELLPICSYCKKIQDVKADTWVPIERYLADRTDTALSHGICGVCREAHFGPYLERSKGKTNGR